MTGATVVAALLGALVVGLLGVVVGAAWIGALLGAALGAAAVQWVVRSADERILAGLGARRVDATEVARLHNLVEGLCVSNGLPLPALAVVDHEGLNCLTVGRTPDTTTLVVTRGLLEGLDRIELEGVVARQLAQVKWGDTHLGTVVSPVAALAPGAVSRTMPERYDLLADLDGVGFTRYPPGLTSALTKTRGRSEVAGVPRSTLHLWFADPAPDAGATAGPHSPIDERIATLQEL